MGRRKLIEDDELLRHAREVFLKSGAFGSTKEISRRAGISEATLFQRFPTKATLFLAAMAPPEVDVEAIFRAPTKRKDPRGALTEIGRRMFSYFRSLIPTVMHLMTHPSIRLADVMAHFQRVPEHALTEGLAAYFREAEARGEAKVGNPMAAAGLLVSAIHSLALFDLMEMHGMQGVEQHIEPFVNALWAGLDPKNRSGAGRTRSGRRTRTSEGGSK